MDIQQTVFTEARDYHFSELLSAYNDGDLIPITYSSLGWIIKRRTYDRDN